VDLVKPRFTELAREALAPMQSMMAQYPLGFAQWLQALSYDLAPPQEIALEGDPKSADTQALVAVLRDGYRPHQVVALGDPDSGTLTVPLLWHRTLVDGQATAYVCVRMVCQPPATDPEVWRRWSIGDNARVLFSFRHP
jgi:uncharacterized protein YyaL (SSP411 family)